MFLYTRWVWTQVFKHSVHTCTWTHPPPTHTHTHANTLRNLITLVRCQLSRLWLLPTAQAIKTGLDIKRMSTEVSWEQLENAPSPTSPKECGSETHVSFLQSENARMPTHFNESGSVSDVSPSQYIQTIITSMSDINNNNNNNNNNSLIIFDLN